MKLLVLLSLCVFCSILPADALDTLIAKAGKLSEIVEELANEEAASTTTDNLLKEMDFRNNDIKQLLKRINKEVEGLSNATPASFALGVIALSFSAFPRRLDPHDWKRAVSGAMTHVDTTFNRFLPIYIESHSHGQDRTRFAQDNLDIEYSMQDLQTMMFSNEESDNMRNGRLTQIVTEISELHPTNCPTTSHIQFALAQLLEAVIIREMKALAMLTYIHMIRYPGENQWNQKLKSDVESFRKRLATYEDQFGKYMDFSAKDLTACDPPGGKRTRDETYFEMEHFEQAVLQKYRSIGRSKNCTNAVIKDLLETDTQNDKCTGDLSSCHYFGSVHVCRLDTSAKRYEWIRGENKNYGSYTSDCPDGTITDYSGISNLMNSHCVCKCHQDDSNYISLTPVMTDVAHNMVVTGIRFVRKNRTLFLQLQEGEILASGRIVADSQRWVDLPEEPKMAPLSLKNNKFYLHDVTLPKDHLVVGVVFVEDDGFFINVTGQQFDYYTGVLSKNTNDGGPQRYYSIDDRATYTEKVLPGVNSIYVNLTHKPDSERNWVQLQMSDLGEDAGQSTVPLFEGVAAEAKSPVGGLGIVHKGVADHAGYIAPRMHALDYGKYLKYKKNNPSAQS